MLHNFQPSTVDTSLTRCWSARFSRFSHCFFQCYVRQCCPWISDKINENWAPMVWHTVNVLPFSVIAWTFWIRHVLMRAHCPPTVLHPCACNSSNNFTVELRVRVIHSKNWVGKYCFWKFGLPYKFKVYIQNISMSFKVKTYHTKTPRPS